MRASLFTPNKEILPAAQKQLWPELRSVTDLGFVLYFEGKDLQSLTPEIRKTLALAVDRVTELPQIKPLVRTLGPLQR